MQTLPPRTLKDFRANAEIAFASTGREERPLRALPPKIVRAFWESPWNSLFLDRQGGKAIAGTPNEDSQGL